MRKIQWIDSIETYAYGTTKHLASDKEEIKCNNMIKRYKKWLTLMMLYKRKQKAYNPNWPKIPGHLYRLLITGGSGSGKTNSLFNLISK